MTETDLKEHILKLPVWQGTPAIETLHGGLSNQSFKVTDRTGSYVVRLGRDYPFHHVSRVREVMTTRAAHVAGFAPEVVHDEPGMMVSRYIEAQTYGAGDISANLDRIARMIRSFHETMAEHVSGAGFMFWVFHVVRDYARKLTEADSARSSDLAGYLEIATRLEAVQIPQPIIFGHHDLLPANLLDDGDRLWLIDFEYAGFGTAMFDLAGLASNASLGPAQSEALLGAYFNRSPTIDEKRSHAAMQCASLLREAMWSMVSEIYLETPGVDFVTYADENLAHLNRALESYQTAYGKF